MFGKAPSKLIEGEKPERHAKKDGGKNRSYEKRDVVLAEEHWTSGRQT